MTTHRALPILLLITILIASVLLRLHHIAVQSVWFDEGYSWHAAIQPSLIGAANADATNPPFYYALLYVAVHLWGDSEFGLRLFSLLIGLPIIPLAYQLARRVSAPRSRTSAGLIAALLAGVLPLLWWASQEARMYTLMALLVMIAALAWDRIITRPTRAAWLALWLAELALLYTHNSAPVIVLWLNAAALLIWISQRSLRRPDARLWLGGQIAVGLLWLPYFVTRFLNLSSANAAIHSAPQLTPEFVLSVWQSFWIVPYERIAAHIDSPVLYLALLIVLAAAVGLALRARARWIFVHIALLTVGLIAALIVLGNDYHGRYIVMIAPLIAVAFAVGIARLRLLGWGIAGGLVVICLINISSALDDSLPYRHDDARSMVQHYADTLTVRDSVIAWSYADRYDLAYYWDRLGVTAHRITLPEGADLDQITPLLPTSGDVALNVWYTQRADRGMMGCLLEDGTTQPPDTFTTYGMTTEIFQQPPLHIPVMRPLDLRFQTDTADLLHVRAAAEIPTARPADQALCLPLMMTLAQSTTADLKALIRVTNALGDQVAADDTIIATADERTPSSAAPGETMRAFPLVRLPVGAPAGTYTLWLRVYDEAQYPSGLSPETSGIGRDVQIGIWTVASVHTAAPPDLSPIPVIGSPDIQFASLNAPAEARPGDRIGLTLAWIGTGTPPDLSLVSIDGTRTPIPASGAALDGYTLDWRALVLPPNATPGMAAFQLPDGTVIGTLNVQDVPFAAQSPPFTHTVDAVFPFGTLVGWSGETSFDRTSPPHVELIWHAAGASDTPLTVFVQILDTSGQVIAQSDAPPASGTRPTTGWRAGEYISDSHDLQWNALAAQGTAMLIAGLYDPVTGARVAFTDGADHIELGQVTVR